MTNENSGKVTVETDRGNKDLLPNSNKESEVRPSKSEHSQSENTSPPKRTACGIWIGNLPWSATKDSLREFVTANSSVTGANITRLHMPGSNDSGESMARKNKGFAYIDFDTNEALKAALDLSETLMGGRRVLI